MRRLIIRLETWVRAHPVALFQICAFLFAGDFARNNVLFLLGAWLSNNAYTRMLPERFECRIRHRIAIFLEQFAQCRFARVNLSDAVGADVAQRVSFRSIGGDRPSLMRSLEERLQGRSLPEAAASRTRLFVVEQAGGSPLPGALVAFPLRVGGYVFSTNDPAACRGAARFYLFHELGHLSAFANYLSYQSTVGSGVWWLVLLWSLVQCPLEPTSWLLVAPLYAALILLFQTKFWNGDLRWQGDVVNEMSADHFGLANIDRADQLSTAKLHLQYPLRQNQRLDPRENLPTRYERLRQSRLRANLERVLADEPLVDVMPSGRTSPPVWIMLAATVCLAAYTRPLDTWSVFFGALLAIATLQFTLFNFVRNRAWDDHIRARLGEPRRQGILV